MRSPVGGIYPPALDDPDPRFRCYGDMLDWLERKNRWCKAPTWAISLAHEHGIPWREITEWYLHWTPSGKERLVEEANAQHDWARRVERGNKVPRRPGCP